MAVNDFVLNSKSNTSNLGDFTNSIFKIYFDKSSKCFYLSSGNENSENDSILFIKLESKHVNK
jgi:hypothetical protein